MSILNHLTINNLKLNKKRTIVTIIGIILSTALICAIAGMATSLQKSMLNMAIANTGDYHIAYLNIPNDEIKYLKNNRNTKGYYQTKSLGYAKIENKNEYKPYIYIEEYDEDALKYSSIRVVDGRLPERENELLVPEHLCDYGFNCNLGSKISLEVGKRISNDGNELTQSNPYYDYNDDIDDYVISKEKVVDTTHHEYTIVGIMERASYDLEDYSSPGYLSITYNNKIESGKSNLYIKYKEPKKVIDLLCETTATNDTEKGKCLSSSEYEKKFDYIYNEDVLRWEGVVRSDNTKSFLYGVVAFVIGIVVISSILVIRNSFSISITERYKQYGMLASIGATGKQIRKNVLYEGFVLGIIGIPLGVLLGIVADVLLVNIVNLIVQNANLLERSSNQLLWYSVPVLPILISILVSSITILLSALIPAIKVSKISPMEAIRSNNDIKIKAKKLKSSKLIKSIFGVGGQIANKNLKRSKKKYRTTIISIVVSVVIFISLSSFVEYGFKLSNNYYTKRNYNIDISYDKFDDINDLKDKLMKDYANISMLDGVKKYAYGKIVSVTIPRKYANDNYIKYHLQDMNEEEKKEYNAKYPDINTSLIVVNDEEYERLIKGLNIADEEKGNGAVFFDNNTIYEDNKSSNVKFLNIHKGDKVKFTLLDDNLEVDIYLLGEASMENGLITEDEGMYFIVSEKWAKKNSSLFNNYYPTTLHLDCQDSDSVTKYVDNLNKSNTGYKLYVYDFIKNIKQNNAMILIISIFLYGFIAVIALISVTNIFNVITTNMMLRRKEFAMLKAIGMTDKEFKKMIWLESLLYGIKSLVIGLFIGILLSYKIYQIFASNMGDSIYIPPIKAIMISIIFVLLIIFITMSYSYKKINKQNIIETIRNDNI